jgi:hypothetical protein
MTIIGSLRVSEVNNALHDIRRQVAACAGWVTPEQLHERAERLQHMAFELKNMAANGGTWADAVLRRAQTERQEK